MDERMTDIEVAGTRLVLTPERVVWWPARRALFAADLHLGRSESRRRDGVPLPEGPLGETLERLERAIEHFDPDRLLLLGDVVEDRSGTTPRVVDRAAELFASVDDVRIVRGNHERRHGPLPTDWRVDLVDGPLQCGPFTLRHKPDTSEGYTLAGHLHPTVELRDATDHLVLPCYAFGPDRAVLPAIHPMTNGVRVEPSPDRTLYAIADGELVEL